MSPLGRRSILALLLAIVLLSLILRYPLVEHERHQTDSYFIHVLSSSIVQNGYAKWTFNALSYLGYYPFSYPSGVPFLLSELSMTTGLNMELAILVTNMIFGGMFCLAVFLLARAFIVRPEYVMLAVLFASVSSRFVDTTYWNASARGPIIVLITLLVATMLHGRFATNRRKVFVAAMLGFACFSCHHMAILLVLFATAYLVVSFESQYVLPRFRARGKLVAVGLGVAILGVLVYVSFLHFSFFDSLLVANLQKTSVFDLESPSLSIILNVALSYTSQIGFILPIAVLGIPLVFIPRALSVKTLYLITVLIVFVPMIGNSLYVSMLLAPFIAIVGSLALNSFQDRVTRRRLMVAAVFLIVSSSMLLPVLFTSRWNSAEYISGDTVAVECDLYNDSMYLRHTSANAYAITNVDPILLQVAANSEVGFLGSDLLLVMSDDISSMDMERNVTWSEASFPVSLYKWFVYDGSPYVGGYVRTLMLYGFSVIADDTGRPEMREYFQKHSALIVFVDNRHGSELVDVYSIRPSPFLDELYDSAYSVDTADPISVESYMIYSSERSTMFLTNLMV